MGISMNDVTPKFERDPEHAPDLSPEDFMARRAVIKQVENWCDEMKEKPELVYQNKWTPILYAYEIVKSSAKRTRDWGNLVFTDMTISRFLIVMIFPPACNCGNYSHHDYDALTRYQADRLLSLVTYLHFEWNKGNPPAWVRATYTTPDLDFKINPELLSKFHEPETTSETVKPPIFHVTADHFIPTLVEGELEKIDNVVAQGERGTSPKRAQPSTRDRVLGTKEGRPNVSGAWKARNPRQCSYCEKISQDKDLQKCARCKLVFYCGRECQRMAWPSHKVFCKVA